VGSRSLGDSYGGYRSRLVEQLRKQGIRDLAVLRAVGETPRHLFVPVASRHQAYEDIALPIGNGQTISQPSTQARFIEALELTGSEKVLEIGTGSGYQTALLASVAATVVSVERVSALAAGAKAALEQAGVSGVTVVVGDGSLGWAPLAPYDGILVAAAGPEIPGPLVSQLAEGGRMIVPVATGAGKAQELWRVSRKSGQIIREKIGDARFVPLIGRHGFNPDNQ
jgi:protein-L-isoaspartate(D-aspartate) O-methyltransferase